MAGSQYGYVRNFELPDPVLPNTYMVVRIDGKGFHKFSREHNFEKPNDGLALELMNRAARHVMNDLRPNISLAFGESDEYSFLLRRSCSLYNRRESKLVTHIVSLFTSAYVFYWKDYFPQKELRFPPSFDGRLVVYPGEKEVRDYFAWRQVDTHINNLYNTTFWTLVLHAKLTESEAHKKLSGTVSSEKNEILFKDFSINYASLPAMFRKGTTLAWDDLPEENSKKKPKAELRTLHVDIIANPFWTEQKDKHSMEQKGVRLDDAAKDSTTTSPPWQQQRRVLDADGLGRRALDE